MAQRTAEDVAAMESELYLLRNELERKDREISLLTAERTRLQLENTMLDGRAREHLIRATRMETIMSQVSAGLVAGLKEMQQDRNLQREMRRQVQEDTIMGTEDPPPAFLSKPQAGTAVSDTARAEQLRGAAERVAPFQLTKPPRKLGSIDPTLADQDSRLPINIYTSEEDQANLRALADRAVSGKAKP